MVLLFTEEQPELRAVVRKFLETRSSEAEVRSQMETDDGFDRQVWRQLAEQIGVRALAMPTFGSVLRRLRRREPRRRPAHRRVHGKGVLLQRLPAHRGREHPIARWDRLHLGDPAHLYFKRAKGSEILLGTPAHHRELLAQHIGL